MFRMLVFIFLAITMPALALAGINVASSNIGHHVNSSPLLDDAIGEGQTPGFHRIIKAGDEPGSEFVIVQAN